MDGSLIPREQAAWRGLLRAHAHLWQQMDARLKAAHGLTLGDYDLLVVLDEAPSGRARMSELAGATLMSSGGLTRRVERLERRGLVRRERCADDGRGQEARLTGSGHALLADARATHRADIRARFLAHLSADEQTRLGGIWERLLAETPTG